MSAGAAAAVVPADRAVPSEFVGKLEANFYCRAWNAKRKKYCRQRAGQKTEHVGVGRCKHHDGGGDQKLQHGLSSRYIVRSPRIGALLEDYKRDVDPLNVLDDLALARALVHDFVERYDTFAAALIAWHDTWEGKYLPISNAEKTALLETIDEYEQLLRERDDPTERQLGQLELARAAIAFLATPQQPKPRTILDVSDAVRHVDVISKVIHRVEQARASNAVSRPELLRILNEMARTTHVVLTSGLADQELAATLYNRITDGWLGAVRL
ncbi:MAG TPA: hypothetical protein VHB25_08500 [Gemmatimonadaceae bacterium]|nr:hypothetical protein [Gemmatimonadaceae bacterium]